MRDLDTDAVIYTGIFGLDMSTIMQISPFFFLVWQQYCLL